MNRALAVAGLASLVAVGCNSLPTTCDRDNNDNPPILYRDGTVSPEGIYASAAFTGPLLYFPGGIRYEIDHELGVVPAWIAAYLSFSVNGSLDGTLAEAAGNQVEIEEVDDRTMVVTNGACAEYWLLVVAGTGNTPAPLP